MLRLLCTFVVLLLPNSAAANKRADEVVPLATVVERLSTQLTNVQTLSGAIFKAQGDRIAALEAANRRTVAFSAYISHMPIVKASEHSTIPFGGVLTNAGGAYNHVTSKFTAPVAGQYFFIVHADCSSDYRRIRVNVNGHKVFSADNDGLEDHHVTGSGLVTLKAGDVVTASHYSSDGHLDAGHESTFTGFLVK